MTKFRRGNPLDMTPTEAQIYELLLDQKYHTAEELAEKALGDKAYNHSVKVHMTRMRVKLHKTPYQIHNLRGAGYRLVLEPPKG